MNTKSIIEIFRGDDSDALGYQTIVGTIHTDLDLTGCKAVFRYLGFFQEFDPIPEDGKLTIVIPSASSMQFPPGFGYASLKVYDIDRKVRTFTNRIPVFVKTMTPCRGGGEFDVEFSPFPELAPLRIFKGPNADDFDLYTGFISKIIDRASAQKYGLSMLFDAMDAEKTAEEGCAASPAAVKAAYDAVIGVLTDNYYTKTQTDEAIDKLAAYYITSNTQGNPFATHADLINATTYYSGGSVRTPTRNDYAIVIADETHNNEKWRYIYSENAQGVGQWEPQYAVEGVITFDDAVTPTSANGVKSSGIWSAIWGALAALPTGFASLYDWCVAQIAKLRDKLDLNVYGYGNASVSFPDGYSITYGSETYTAPSGGESIEFYGPIESTSDTGYYFWVPYEYKDDTDFNPTAQNVWCLTRGKYLGAGNPTVMLFATSSSYIISDWNTTAPTLTLSTGEVTGDAPTMARPLGATGDTLVKMSQMNTALAGKEDASNKVTSLTAQSTDTQYPSAKCVYDAIQGVDVKPTRIYNESGTDALDDKGQLFKSAVVNSSWTLSYNGGQNSVTASYSGYETISGVSYYRWKYVVSSGTFSVLYNPANGEVSFYGWVNRGDGFGNYKILVDTQTSGVNPTTGGELSDISGASMYITSNTSTTTCDLEFIPMSTEMQSDPYAHFSLESLPDRTWAAGVWAVGDLVKYSDKAYRCKAAATANDTTAPSSDTSHWTEVPVLANKQNALSQTQLAKIAAVSDALAFDATHSYAKGDPVVYNGTLYTFTAAHTGAWTGTDVSAVDIVARLAGKANDADVVHTTGDETIAGTKTFTGPNTVIPFITTGQGGIQIGISGRISQPTAGGLLDDTFVPNYGEVKSAIRYTLPETPIIISSASSETVEGETIYYGEATLADRTANIVGVAVALDELRVTIPPAISGKVRDFGLYVAVGFGEGTALAAPALVPVAPTGETITLMNAEGEMPTLADGTTTESGTTVLYFTEVVNGTFLVKGEEVKEIV